jgi:agmatinase
VPVEIGELAETEIAAAATLWVEAGLVRSDQWIIAGYRGYAPNDPDLKWMTDRGIRLHGMAQVQKYGWDQVVDWVLEEAADEVEHLYITIDVDVFDPAYAIGTGTPEPGGLTSAQVFQLVRRLCAEKHLVGIDIVEVNPFMDPTNMTAQVVNRLMREALTGIAMHKMGLTEADYLSSDATDPNGAPGSGSASRPQ